MVRAKLPTGDQHAARRRRIAMAEGVLAQIVKFNCRHDRESSVGCDALSIGAKIDPVVEAKVRRRFESAGELPSFRPVVAECRRSRCGPCQPRSYGPRSLHERQ